MGSKSKQTTTSNQTQNPWAPATGALQSGIGQMQNYMNSPGANSAYGGDRVAGLDGMTTQGMAGIQQGVGNQSSDYYSRVLNGDYLNAGNPHQAALDQNILESVMPNMNAMFSNAGMTGSTIHQGQLAKALASGLAAPRYQNYQNERGMMGSAAAAMPGLEQQNIDNLMRAGNINQTQQQAELDAARQAWEEQRTAPIRGASEVWPMLAQAGSMGGTSSGTSTSVQKSSPGLAQSLLGAGMMAASLGTGGLGAGLGGLIGGGLTGMQQGFAGMHSPSFWAPTVTKG